MGRPRIHDENTRAELLEAAGQLLRQEGAGAVSLRRLAGQVGASTQVIYTLFSSKQGLIRAMHREGFATLDSYLSAVEPNDDVAAHLRELALAYRSAALEQPHIYDVMFGCPFPEFEPSPDDQRLALGTLNRLRTALRGHQTDGQFEGHDLEQLTLQIWALAHGLASLELQGAFADLDTVEHVWASAIDSMVTGLLRGP